MSIIEINIFMKTALIVGGGSKWGAVLTNRLAKAGYKIDLITSTGIQNKKVTNHLIDWWACDERTVDSILENLSADHYDLIFFNQNSGGGPNDTAFAPGDIFPIEFWNKANWINCQLTYYIIKKLSLKINNTTKIGWMLTGLIDSIKRDHWQYAGYASVKATNVYMMRAFSQYHDGIFFAIQPLWFPEADQRKDANRVINVIEKITLEDSGRIFMKDGSEWERFKPAD